MIQQIEKFEKVVVCRDLKSNQLLLKSSVNFRKGDIISLFSSKKTLSEPTYLTVQISRSEHIMLNPSYLQCINHSCKPNVFFDTTTYELKALMDIQKEEELTFFYPSTEWEMIQPFECKCEEDSCLGMIRGAKFLPFEVLEKYQFSAFVETYLTLNQ